MIKQISKTEAIKAKMQEQGRVSYLDKPEHITAIMDMNERLKAVRREFQVKDRDSQITASNVILTS